MLVGADDAAIDKMEGPVELPGGVGRGLAGRQKAIPDAGLLPAAETAIQRLPGAVGHGHVPPGGAGFQPPEDPVEDAAMVMVRAPSAWLGRWQQGRHLLPP